MATKQVKFYSMSSASFNAQGYEKDIDGIYFLDNNEIYKGTTRFGANKVTADATVPTTGAIAGDINIYGGVTKVYNGSTWVDITDTTALDLKASVGASNSTSHGAWIHTQLASDAEPVVELVISAITNASAIVDNSAYLTTGSAIFKHTSGLIQSQFTAESDQYIKGITKTQFGVLTAETGTFSTDVKKAIGNGFDDDTNSGVTVSVTTTSGSVALVQVDAANLTPTTFKLPTGPSVNEIVTTIGPSTGNGAATDSQLVTAKAIRDALNSLDNAMHFKGVIDGTNQTWLPSSGNDDGDIWIVTTESATKPSEGSQSDPDKITAGQEYIWTGDKWELIGDQSISDDLIANKAHIGTGNAAGAHGVSATVVLNSDVAPTLSVYVDAITASASIATGVDKVVTAGAVADYVTGRITGGTSTSTLNGVTVTVGTDVYASVSQVTIEGLGTAASKDFTTTVASTGDEAPKLPTGAAVFTAISAAISALNATATTSAARKSETGVSVTVNQVDGKVTTAEAQILWCDASGYIDN